MKLIAIPAIPLVPPTAERSGIPPGSVLGPPPGSGGAPGSACGAPDPAPGGPTPSELREALRSSSPNFASGNCGFSIFQVHFMLGVVSPSQQGPLSTESSSG